MNWLRFLLCPWAEAVAQHLTVRQQQRTIGRLLSDASVTAEHVQVLERDNTRMEFDLGQYRRFFAATVPSEDES